MFAGGKFDLKREWNIKTMAREKFGSVLSVMWIRISG